MSVGMGPVTDRNTPALITPELPPPERTGKQNGGGSMSAPAPTLALRIHSCLLCGMNGPGFPRIEREESESHVTQLIFRAPGCCWLCCGVGRRKGSVFASRSQAIAQYRPEPWEVTWKDFVCDLSLLGGGGVSDLVCDQICMLLGGRGGYWGPYPISWL